MSDELAHLEAQRVTLCRGGCGTKVDKLACIWEPATNSLGMPRLDPFCTRACHNAHLAKEGRDR